MQGTWDEAIQQAIAMGLDPRQAASRQGDRGSGNSAFSTQAQNYLAQQQRQPAPAMQPQMLPQTAPAPSPAPQQMPSSAPIPTARPIDATIDASMQEGNPQLAAMQPAPQPATPNPQLAAMNDQSTPIMEAINAQMGDTAPPPAQQAAPAPAPAPVAENSDGGYGSTVVAAIAALGGAEGVRRLIMAYRMGDPNAARTFEAIGMSPDDLSMFAGGDQFSAGRQPSPVKSGSGKTEMFGPAQPFRGPTGEDASTDVEYRYPNGEDISTPRNEYEYNTRDGKKTRARGTKAKPEVKTKAKVKVK